MQARIIAAALAVLAGTAQAGSPPVNWPGASPCNATLQACIDGVADGRAIDIVTDTPIDENLNLYNRSLTLGAGAGYHPSLARTRWIVVSSSAIAGDLTVNLSGLTLTDGYVWLAYAGTGTARYDVRRMTLTQTPTGSASYIRVAANGGTVEAMVYDNRVSGRPLGLNNGLVEFAASGGATLDANALYNRVTSTSPTAVSGAGILLDAAGNAAGTFKAHANEVRGGFFRAGIYVSEGLFSSTASNYAARLYNNVLVCAPDGGTGIGLVVNNGTLDAQAVNNTISRCNYGILASQWSGGTSASAAIAGIVKNNLVVANTTLSFNAALTPDLANDYNLLNGATSVATGAHTITAAAQLASNTAPRLTATSPAIDAADTATLGFGLIFNGLPVVDADGLRRIKEAGGGDDADIGAYEYGDLSFRHTATPANTSSYISTFDHPGANAQSAANLMATPNFGGNLAGPGIANDQPFGVYYASARWRVFNEDAATPMPGGAKFNVFAPAPGSGSFRHVSTAANTVGRFTEIDSGSTNNVPGYIVLATQNWSAGSGIYNAHPIGLVYSGATSRWQIANLDSGGATMPANAGFNVYAQPESPNAFRVSAAGGSSSIVLDHPLLNGVPCAQVNTTRLWSGSTVVGNHDVYYGSDGTWRIFGYSALPAGTTFHVVIDPRQVFECTDRIFADGFQ